VEWRRPGVVAEIRVVTKTEEMRYALDLARFSGLHALMDDIRIKLPTYINKVLTFMAETMPSQHHYF